MSTLLDSAPPHALLPNDKAGGAVVASGGKHEVFEPSGDLVDDIARHQTLPEITANVTDFNRLFQAEAPDYAVKMEQAQVYQYMDRIGLDVILEEIARGNIPNTLALRYKVPIIKFREWLDSRVKDGDTLKRAVQLCAESMVVKSHMVLERDADDTVQAAQMRQFSKRIADIAASLAPADWGAKKPEEHQPMGQQAVIINIGGGAVIPGTEVLAKPGQVIEHQGGSNA